MENERKASVAHENATSIDPMSINRNDQNKWCFAWLANAPLAEGTEKAVLVKNAKWQPGSRISVSFLDGDPVVQEKVMKVAKQWVGPRMANLELDFRNDTNDTDIRISFRYSGSWSTLGTTCKKITDISQPTMNYGWLGRNSSEDEINRVVLHEFGHALGLTHEHLHPEGGIEWDKEQVRKDLKGSPNYWPDEVIDNNMFKTYEKGETNFTKLDPNSIMMYPIPSKWTKNGFSVGLNSKLSEKDQEFIREQYPHI